jgi:hypothetical protein
MRAIVRLDCRPVVAAGKALVDRFAEAAGVVAHGRLGQPEAIGDLPAAQALPEELVNSIARHERMFA